MNDAAAMLGLRRRDYLRRVFVPAVLPSLVTGCVTAWGGGWNAIIFSEYVVAGGRRYEVAGIGAPPETASSRPRGLPVEHPRPCPVLARARLPHGAGRGSPIPRPVP